MHARTHTHTCTHTHARTHARTHTHTHTHTRTHACTRARARTHACTHARTHTHTHTRHTSQLLSLAITASQHTYRTKLFISSYNTILISSPQYNIAYDHYRTCSTMSKQTWSAVGSSCVIHLDDCNQHEITPQNLNNFLDNSDMHPSQFLKPHTPTVHQ